MTNEQMRDLVKECGLNWHRGFMPLFEGDDTNRYAVLIAEAMRIEREACAEVDESMVNAYLEFAGKATHLHHPDVPYNGTDNGDSQDAWMRRLVKAVLEHAIRARINK